MGSTSAFLDTPPTFSGFSKGLLEGEGLILGPSSHIRCDPCIDIVLGRIDMTVSHGRFICDEHIKYQLEAGFDRIPSKLWRHIVLQRLRHPIRRFVEIFEVTIAEHPGPNVRAASNDGDLCEKRINRMFDSRLWVNSKAT